MLDMMIIFRSAMTRAGEMSDAEMPDPNYRPVLDPIDLDGIVPVGAPMPKSPCKRDARAVADTVLRQPIAVTTL